MQGIKQVKLKKIFLPLDITLNNRLEGQRKEREWGKKIKRVHCVHLDLKKFICTVYKLALFYILDIFSDTVI